LWHGDYHRNDWTLALMSWFPPRRLASYIAASALPEHLLEHIVVMTVLSRLAIRPRLCKNFLAARKRFLMAFLAQIPSGNAPALSRS
jgi:hypothetical protein